jgi:hypothetical protein
MAIYSNVSAAVAQTYNGVIATGYDGSNNPLIASVSSVLIFGEATTNANTQDAWIMRQSGFAGNALTPEKLNSRSPATPNNAYATNSINWSGSGIVIGKHPLSFFSWRSDFKRQYLAQGQGGADETISAEAGADSTNIIDTTVLWSDRFLGFPSQRLRRNRSAFWRMSDCWTCNHQKTGGGAYQIFMPHALNDGITWIEPQSWGLGTRGDEWSMSLFGGPPPAVIRYWPWFVAQRK